MSSCHCFDGLSGLAARMQMCSCPLPAKPAEPAKTVPEYSGYLSVCPDFLTQEQFGNLKTWAQQKKKAATASSKTSVDTLLRRILATLESKDEKGRITHLGSLNCL